jgi:hypothetical protein
MARHGGWCQCPDSSVSEVHSDGPQANALLDELYSPRLALKVGTSVNLQTSTEFLSKGRTLTLAFAFVQEYINEVLLECRHRRPYVLQ